MLYTSTNLDYQARVKIYETNIEINKYKYSPLETELND